MSTDLLRKEIERFLASAEQEVICISGQWGVGKTYAWNLFLREAKAVALRRYAYVSLFGINSLEELKFSIFENTVDSSQIGVEPSLSTLQSNTAAVLQPFGRKAIGILQQLQFVKQHIGDIGPAWFLTVKEMIVCIDDIERRGRGLEIRDVLGIVSKLKDQRRCKVAIILNDEALDESQKDFITFFEKVVDVKLQFAPTAVESASIALQLSSEVGRLLSQYCVTLGISNIRVIKKIERAAKQLEEILKQFDEGVLNQALHALVLLSWSHYEPLTVPPLDFLKSRVSRFIKDSKAEIPAHEAGWNALLEVYGFSMLDEFDLIILQGVQQGFFDASSLRKYATPLSTKAERENRFKPFREAWALYHDSFDDNEHEFLNALQSSFRAAIDFLSPMDLNGTMTALKSLGKTEMAGALLREYIDFHSADRSAFDLSHYPFGSEIKDPDLIEAFETKLSTFVDERSAITILQSMGERHGWIEDDLVFLANVEPQEYYAIFREHKGTELRKLINACLQFDRILGASPTMKQVSERAKEALARIGRETRLNAVRVQKYGLKPEGDPPEDSTV